MSQLQVRLAEVDREIEQLASLSLRSGIGATGYRSRRFDDPDHPVSIQIDLGQQCDIDQIVIVPTIWRDGRTGFRADGFPVEFRVEVGSDASTDGRTIARYEAEDLLLPRLAPLVVDCPPALRGSWIRLVATSLGSRLWDGSYDLQLSEIMVFSGEENVALHSQVEVSSNDRVTAFIDKPFLVDGHVPYLMDATGGEQSIAFVSQVEGDADQPSLIIDLGQTEAIDRVHLHAVDTSDTAPQSHGTDFAIPRKLRIVGARQSDFSEPRELCTIEVNSIYDSGPIMMRRFDAVECRYVALIAVEPFLQTFSEVNRTQIGFAEIELFSSGRNVALGKDVKASFQRGNRGRRLKSLTDGNNFYGAILPVREWMNQLARRHDLEVERPRIVSDLNGHFERQSINLRLARWLVATLAVAIGFVLLGNRLLRLREVASVKERLAADLHDELGANLHTIGLLSDLAEDSSRDADERTGYLNRIRTLTERTGQSMRHLVDANDSVDLHAEFLADMRQAAESVAVNVDHDIEVEGEQYLNLLKPRTRLDLFLFYKECLVNISRHSGATQLQTRLVGNRKSVLLAITDNGHGLSDADLSDVPPSLRRRARLLGASVSVEQPDAQGTSIHLTLRTRRWWRRK